VRIEESLELAPATMAVTTLENDATASNARQHLLILDRSITTCTAIVNTLKIKHKRFKDVRVSHPK
jgi:hypothetical protein